MTIPFCITEESVTKESFLAQAFISELLLDVLASGMNATIVEGVATNDFLSTLCNAVTDEARFALTVVGLVFIVVETVCAFNALTTAARVRDYNALVLGISDIT